MIIDGYVLHLAVPFAKIDKSLFTLCHLLAKGVMNAKKDFKKIEVNKLYRLDGK